MSQVFKVAKLEFEKAQEWQEAHGCKSGPLAPKLAIGESSVDFIFNTTNDMYSVRVKCLHCQSETDITEYILRTNCLNLKRKLEVDSTFKLKKKEFEKAQEWQKAHGCENGPLDPKRALGRSSLSFIFHGSTVGDTIYARCERCKAETELCSFSDNP